MVEPKTCSICQQPYTGFGNNAQPVNDGRCCDECNWRIVTPVRIQNLMRRAMAKKDN
jgi:hypothetical protein